MLDRRAGPQVYAVVSMYAGIYLADIVSKRALQRDRQGFDHQHVLAQLPRRCRNFGANEPCPDPERSRSAVQRVPEVTAVTKGAERPDVVCVGDGGEEARRPAEAEHQNVDWD